MTPYPNIAVFDEACAVVLERLYASFPAPVAMDVERLLAEHAPPHDPTLGLGDDERRRLYAATIEFLEAEGYLRYHARRHDGLAFSRVVLTARGLGVLTRSPEPLKHPVTLGERLRPALGEAGREALRQVVRLVLGG